MLRFISLVNIHPLLSDYILALILKELRKKGPPNQIFVLSSPAFTGTQTPSCVLYFFARPSYPPSRLKAGGGRWRTKNFIRMVLPPFSLIRDFGKQNTRGNFSKIFVSLYELLTDRIEIRQSQPLAWPSNFLYVMLAGCEWWISIRHVDNTKDWRKFWKRFRECFVFQSRVSTKTVVTQQICFFNFQSRHRSFKKRASWITYKKSCKPSLLV